MLSALLPPHTHPPTHARAVTLIELLVVIAVILILASLVLGITMRALDSARSAQCRSNLSQFGKAMRLYANANKQFMPAIGAPPGYKWWYDALAEHMGTDDRTRKIYHCPAKPQAKVGYGVNVRFADPTGSTHNWNKTLPITIVVNPSQTIAIADAGRVRNFPAETNPQKWKETDASPPDGKIRFPYTDDDSLWNNASSFRPVPRHRGKCNCMMFDGSTQSHRPADLLGHKYGEGGCLFDNQ